MVKNVVKPAIHSVFREVLRSASLKYRSLIQIPRVIWFTTQRSRFIDLSVNIAASNREQRPQKPSRICSSQCRKRGTNCDVAPLDEPQSTASERSRTSTSQRTLGPKPSASANSATLAGFLPKPVITVFLPPWPLCFNEISKTS